MPNKPKQYRPTKRKSKSFTFRKGGRSKGYDSTWERYRRRFLHHNPNCYCCPSPAKVIDHIVVHRGDKELFEATTNFVEPYSISWRNRQLGDCLA